MDKNIRIGLGKRIKALRETLGLTQKDIAEKTNDLISVTRLSGYENENRAPDLYTLACIAEALGTSLDYLYYGKGPKKCTYIKPKSSDAIIRSFGRLIDFDMLFVLDGKVYLNDYNERIIRFIRDYYQVRQGLGTNKQTKLKILEEIAIDEMNIQETCIEIDTVFTALKNMNINLYALEKKHAEEKKTNNVD